MIILNELLDRNDRGLSFRRWQQETSETRNANNRISRDRAQKLGYS